MVDAVRPIAAEVEAGRLDPADDQRETIQRASLHGRHARPRFADSHGRRNAGQQFSAVADQLCRDLGHRAMLARISRGRPARGDPRFCRARPALWRVKIERINSMNRPGFAAKTALRCKPPISHLSSEAGCRCASLPTSPGHAVHRRLGRLVLAGSRPIWRHSAGGVAVSTGIIAKRAGQRRSDWLLAGADRQPLAWIRLHRQFADRRRNAVPMFWPACVRFLSLLSAGRFARLPVVLAASSSKFTVRQTWRCDSRLAATIFGCLRRHPADVCRSACRGCWRCCRCVIVVKMGDTGAYTVGRLIGRHKMAPRLSPGKTGKGPPALLLCRLGSWFVFNLLGGC